MRADYPGAIVVEAANYGYGTPNQPKTWCFHTPEEKADDDPQTPGYIAGTDRDASYTYFISSWLGLVFQLVPESEGAYANYLNGKPAPPWSDGTHLNLQTLSLAFEGEAHNIHLTMPRGCPQWKAGVGLVADRTKALGLNLDWAIQHKDVSIYRGDCGQFDQTGFIADVKAALRQEDDVGMTQAQLDRLKRVEDEVKRLREQSVAGLQAQVDWLRQELGLAPLYDASRTHPSALLERVAELEAADTGGSPSLQQIADGLEITAKS